MNLEQRNEDGDNTDVNPVNCRDSGCRSTWPYPLVIMSELDTSAPALPAPRCSGATVSNVVRAKQTGLWPT